MFIFLPPSQVLLDVPKMPLNQTSPEGADWDEELSNIDPQAVYPAAWGDFGLRPRCPSHSTPLEAAGWDEELSNIDPQAVYPAAWDDFGLRPRCPSHSTPLEAAGWDEELSNIDPQAVYHTAWGDFGNKKAGFVGNVPAAHFPTSKTLAYREQKTVYGTPPFCPILYPRFLVFAQDAPQSAPHNTA